MELPKANLDVDIVLDIKIIKKYDLIIMSNDYRKHTYSRNTISGSK